MSYRYQQNITYFGRSPDGGWFTGLTTPMDISYIDGNQITLSFRPGIKLLKDEEFKSPHMYIGVYLNDPPIYPVTGDLYGGNFQHLPLPGESEAMVDMVSNILGNPRHGVTFVCSPLCCNGIPLNNKDEKWFETSEALYGVKNIMDFSAEVGIKYIQDYLPWAGQYQKMAEFTKEGAPDSNVWVRGLLEYEKKLGLLPLAWTTFNNVNPWQQNTPPFRSDKPEWMVKRPHSIIHFRNKQAADADCFGSDEYLSWYTNFMIEHMGKNGYQGFSIDGDFDGNGGWFTTSSVAHRCQRENHKHVKGEAQYVMMLAMQKYLASIRETYPDAFIWMMRPMMDLGVWSYCNGDAVFTILEDGKVENLTGIQDQPDNVIFGDKIRIWSRIRRDRHFCPHYLDQIQLFPNFDGGGGKSGSFSNKNLDYLMLSAFSMSPNQCYWSGPLEDWTQQDKDELKKWLLFAKNHEKYLLTRKDLHINSCHVDEIISDKNYIKDLYKLSTWPSKGSIDGSSHIVNNKGLIFLFNPNNEILKGVFDLSNTIPGIYESIKYKVKNIYPKLEEDTIVNPNDKVIFVMQPQSVKVLWLELVD